MAHDGALGQLDFEQRGVQAGLGQDLFDFAHHPALAELHGREVDRYRHRREARVTPGLRLATGLTQHPVAE